MKKKTEKRSILANTHKFGIGEHVFAHIKGYKPWPAKIIGFNPNNQIEVYFFGSNQKYAFY